MGSAADRYSPHNPRCGKFVLKVVEKRRAEYEVDVVGERVRQASFHPDRSLVETVGKASELCSQGQDKSIVSTTLDDRAAASDQHTARHCPQTASSTH